MASKIPSVQLLDICFNIHNQKTINVPQIRIENIKNIKEFNQLLTNLKVKESSINLTEIYKYF